MARTEIAKKGFLARLRASEAGNTLAMTAAAIVPIIALVGGGVDVSRYYITKSRLQSACDAAVLAGRKSMTGVNWTTTDSGIATNFFNTNFPSGTLGSTASGITFSVDTAGVVTGTATATSPATLMKLFDVANKVLTTTCRAELQLPNTDIMFALDTTLSMNETNPGDSQSRIQALRAAVISFQTSIANASAPGTQVRYGFVPFSSTVNVGRLLKREWMVDSWTYQSRVPDGTDTGSSSSSSPTTTNTSSWTTLSGNTSTHDTWGRPENCTGPANTYSWSDSTTSETSPYPGGGTQTVVTRTRTHNGSQYSASIVGGNCRIRETRYNNLVQQRTETTIPVPSSSSNSWTNYYWNYQPVTFDVSPLKGTNADGLMAGGSITAQVANNHNNLTTTWSGCIEERKTLRPGETATKPGEPFDLNIDLVPSASDDDTRWRPHLPQLVFVRRATNNWSYSNVTHVTNNYTRADNVSSNLTAVCPTAARRLTAMTNAEVTTYVNGLTPAGYTYLDIGMLWAARLISPTGLFASDNQVASNGGSISRHIIFMTDGEIYTRRENYEAYGLSALDRRRTSTGSLPSDSDQNTIVGDRFASICTATKAKGITVWVIAFGTTLSDMLKDCATSRNGHAFEAANTTELNEAFSNIASQIAQLRLTQ